MENPKYKLWQALNEANYYTKSYEDFDSQFSSPESIKKLHGALAESEYYTKGEDAFVNQFFASDTKGASSEGTPAPSGTQQRGSMQPFQGGLAKGEPVRADRAKERQQQRKVVEPIEAKSQGERRRQYELSQANSKLNDLLAQSKRDGWTDEQTDEYTRPVLEHISRLEGQGQAEQPPMDLRAISKADIGQQQDVTRVETPKIAKEDYVASALKEKEKKSIAQIKEEHNLRSTVEQFDTNVDVAKVYSTINRDLDKLPSDIYVDAANVRAFHADKDGIGSASYKNFKKGLDAVTSDYIKYLEATRPKYALEQKEKYQEIKAKESLDFKDKEWLAKFQEEAVAIRAQYDSFRLAEMKLAYDWDGYEKVAADISVRAKNLNARMMALGIKEGVQPTEYQAKEANAILQEYDLLDQRLNQERQKSGITEDVENQAIRLSNQLSTINDVQYLIPSKDVADYREELKSRQSNQYEFYKEHPYIGAGVELLNGIAKSAVSGLTSIGQLPKVFADAVSIGDGYGFTDQLYEATNNINESMEYMIPSAISTEYVQSERLKKLGAKYLPYEQKTRTIEDLPPVMQFASNVGSGIGSILSFIETGGTNAGLLKALGVSSKKADTAGLWMAGFIQAEGSAYQHYINNGADTDTAARYAGFEGVLTATASLLMPDIKYAQAEMAPSVLNVFRRTLQQTGSQSEAFSKAMGEIYNKAGTIAIEAVKEGTEEDLEQAAKDVANTLAGEQYSQDAFTLKNYINAHIAGLEPSFVINFLKASTQRTPSQQQVLKYIGANYSDILSKIKEYGSSGINEDQFKELEKELKGFKSTYDAFSSLPEFSKLSEPTKDRVLAQAQRKKMIERNAAEAGIDKSLYEDEIKAIDEEINSILTNSKNQKPAFTSFERIVVEEKPVTDDSKDKQGIPSEVGEGQGVVAAQPDQGAGAAPTGPSGMVQAPSQEEVELNDVRLRINQIEVARQQGKILEDESPNELKNLKSREKELSAVISEQVTTKPVSDVEKAQKRLDGVNSRINPNANHPLFNVGQKHSDGNNYIVKNVEDNRTDTTKDGVEVITKILSPAEVDENGKMTKAADVEVSIFDSNEQAQEYINSRYNKYKAIAEERLAKAKEELAALEEAPTLTAEEEAAMEPIAPKVEQVMAQFPDLTENEAEDAVVYAESNDVTTEEAVSAVREVPTPKEGDTVELPPIMKGGMKRTMVFEGGTWKQKVGGVTTGISPTVQEAAQTAFEGTQEVEKPSEGAKEEKKILNEVVNKPFGELPENDKDFTGLGAGYLKNNMWASKKLGRGSKTSLFGNIENTVKKGKKVFLYFVNPKLSDGKIASESEYENKLNEELSKEGVRTLTQSENNEIENRVGKQFADSNIKAQQVGDPNEGTFRIFDTKNTELVGYVEATPELIEKLKNPNLSEDQARKILFEEAGIEFNDDVLIHANENEISKYTPSEKISQPSLKVEKPSEKSRERSRKMREMTEGGKAAENVSKFLSDSGVSVEVLDDDQYDKTTSEEKGQSSPSQGLFVSDIGKIYLRRSSIDSEWGRVIAFHEGIHPVINIIRNTNPKAYNALVKAVMESAKTNPAVAKVVRMVRSTPRYAEGGEQVIEDEVLVEVLAQIASGDIKLTNFSKTTLEKIVDFMNSLAKVFGLPRVFVNTPRAELQNLAKQLTEALNNQGNIADIVGKKNVMKYENNISQESGTVETGSVVYAGQASANIERGGKIKNPYRKSVNLPVRTLQSLLDEYGDNVIVVNSDPTGLGTVKLPSGKTIELDGGIGYMAIQENIDAGVGFAASSDARVKFLYKTANQMNEDGKLKDGKVLVLVMVQKADSMLGNNYTPDYVADALAKIPKNAISKERLTSLLIDPLKKDTFRSLFYKESKIPKMEPYKKDSKKTKEENNRLEKEYIKEYNQEVAKIVESNAKKKAEGIAKIEAIEKEIKAIDPRTAHDDMIRIFHELSFVQAQKYFDSILGSYTNKTTNYKLEISKLLYKYANADQKNLFKVLGEKSLVDQLLQDPKSWGYAVAAFVHNTTKQEEDLKGIKHNLFNAKFQGDERFILDEAYKVNDIMTEFNEQQIKKVEEGDKKGAVFAAQQASQGMYPSGKAVIPDKGIKFESLTKTGDRYQASAMDRGIPTELPTPSKERITEASQNLQNKFRRDGIPLTIQEAKEVVEELISWKDWYEGISQMVQDNFDEYAADYMMFMFGSAVAADSAGTIGTALNNLERLYAQEEIKGLPIMKRNIYEILSGLPVTSDKISNFIAAGLGDKNAIPVDMHVWSFINSFPTTKKSPTKKDFERAKEFVRAVADGLGWDPREVQAAMWAANMLRLNQKPDTYEEYIQKKIDTGLQKQIQGWREKGYKPIFAVRKSGEKIETVFLQDTVKEKFAPKLEEVKQKISKAQPSAMDRNQIKSGFEPSKVFSGANEDVANASDQYKEENGLSQQTPSFILSVSENDAKRVADAYEKMKHDPENPQVKQGFSELITEIKKQAEVLLSMGYKFQLSKEGEGYGSDSKKMADDVRKNKRIFVDPSSKSFGTKRTFDKDNIGLQDSGYKDANGIPMTNVELIRAVHDLFGHAEFGNGFGPIGEENAWRNHMSMFTPLAQKALTSTTRGQNSWVNFGPHMRNEDGSIKKSGDEGYLTPSKRPFAEQKIGFLPEWAMDNSYGDKVTINGKSVKPVNKYVLEGTEMYEINDGKAFYEAIKAAKESRGADGIQVSLKSAEDYQNIIDNGGRLIVTKDGLAGLMVEADGNVGSGFAHADIPAGKNTLKPLLLMAIKLGARYTDAYDTYLPPYYAKFGFKALNRIEFNEEFAEEGWEKTTLSSKPDVVVMYWDGGSRENVEKNYGKFEPYSKSQGEYTDDYDGAIEAAREKSNEVEENASLVPPKIPAQASAMDRGVRIDPVLAAVDSEMSKKDAREMAAERKENKATFGKKYEKAVRVTKNFEGIVKELEAKGILTKKCP